MDMVLEQRGFWNWRQQTAKAVAPVIALMILFVFIFAPIYVFRVLLGIPLDAEGPRGELWLLVLGIGMGTVAANLGFHAVLAKLGGFTREQSDAIWKEQ